MWHRIKCFGFVVCFGNYLVAMVTLNTTVRILFFVFFPFRFSNSYSDMDRFLGLLSIIILPL